MPSPSISLDDMDMDLTIGGGLSIGATTTSTIIGDPSRPVATLVTGDPNKPVATLVTGDANKPIATLVTGDANKPVATLITGDPNKPVASTIDVLNLPHFSLQDIKDLKLGRIHMPHYSQLCFKMFGMDVFSFCLSGESQVISDHYVPNDYEKCEVPCCEVDTRPFPDHQKG
ncbi:MAG: hypothetical protein IT270_10475 [Saprospiraceae bacterium]|nr:hypothetical protein [Saprospiraceae bacterium]